MARALAPLIDFPAASCGRLIASYSRCVVSESSAEMVFDAPYQRAPTVWIGWHEANLIALALHPILTGRAAMAFVPPGLHGAAMRGWLEGLGVAPIPLAPDARRGLGLRQMEAALASEKDVMIAVDGPSGPRHQIAPGAMWLARAMNVDIRPTGCAAFPAIRLPRWDRLIVPLPGARVAMAVGGALPRETSPEAKRRLAATLHALSSKARGVLASGGKLAPREAVPWR
jgi:lysophospholipid acyltransferase (LPLAT)-like uncharacterized protein